MRFGGSGRPGVSRGAKVNQCQSAAITLRNVAFLGHRGRSRHYNMDQVVADALAAFRRLRAAGW
jgi:UDP-galactopyranose mutase